MSFSILPLSVELPEIIHYNKPPIFNNILMNQYIYYVEGQ